MIDDHSQSSQVKKNSYGQGRNLIIDGSNLYWKTNTSIIT